MHSRIRLSQPTTFYINSHLGNDTTGNGLTRQTAFLTPQHARDFVFRNYDCNLYPVTFFYINSGIPYPGVICAYPLLGLGHDYGENHEGELDSAGNVSVLINDTTAGCFHAAGGAQIYIKNFGMRSFGPAPCVIAPYQGFVTVNHCVFYGSEAAPIIDAGPVQGRVAIDSTCWFIWTGLSSVFAGSSFLNAHDGGSITIPANTQYILGAPVFSFGFANVSNAGRIQCRAVWSGAARGRRWTSQSAGMFLTGHPTAAGLDSYMPGDANGQDLDGTAVIL